MFYDTPPKTINAPETGPNIEQYRQVLRAAELVYPARNGLHMGFEPGKQTNGGVWEGIKVDEDVSDFMKDQDYQGAMFWTINDPATGHNSAKIAEYIQDRP